MAENESIGPSRKRQTTSLNGTQRNSTVTDPTWRIALTKVGLAATDGGRGASVGIATFWPKSKTAADSLTYSMASQAITVTSGVNTISLSPKPSAISILV
jgi:hypothetical protein